MALKEPSETTLVISDIQYPFAHRDHLDFLDALRKRYKPTRIVCIGDEVDYHALSDYVPDPDGMSPGDELIAAKKELKKLFSLFPDAISLTSNHTARPIKRAFKCGIPKALLRGYAEVLDAPAGWSWADKTEIDGVLYEHGLGCSGPMGHLKAALDNMQSTVIGHLHSNFGVAYAANPKCLLFGMAVGCLCDNDAYAFRYGQTTKKKPILGAGIVDKGIPTAVPMMLARGGRWRGRL